jgi:hypothetical protein
MWKVGRSLSYTRHVKRLNEVPYGGKLGFYLLGNKSWIVTENGYFETDPEDFKHKFYIMNIPSLSDKELADLRNKIVSGAYTHEDAKKYNYCIRRIWLYTNFQSNKEYYDFCKMPGYFNMQYSWR